MNKNFKIKTKGLKRKNKLNLCSLMLRLGVVNHKITLALGLSRVIVGVAKLQVYNIASSNKVISQVSFTRGLDKTSTKIIVNLQLFEKSIKL